MSFNSFKVNDNVKYFSYSFIQKVKKIIKQSGINIADAKGKVINLYSIKSTVISLNGFRNDSFEPFILDLQSPNKYLTCKTGDKPYDVVVKAILMLAKEYNIVSDFSIGGGVGDEPSFSNKMKAQDLFEDVDATYLDSFLNELEEDDLILVREKIEDRIMELRSKYRDKRAEMWESGILVNDANTVKNIKYLPFGIQFEWNGELKNVYRESPIKITSQYNKESLIKYFKETHIEKGLNYALNEIMLLTKDVGSSEDYCRAIDNMID